MMKCCFVSSSGGHWEELSCLKQLSQKYDSFFVTEAGVQAGITDSNIYILPQINRKEKKFITHFIKLFYNAYVILKKERPSVIVTTGALFSYPFCLLGKIFKSKIIFIESFARIDDKSLTGSLVYPISDLFIVQWKSLINLYPKAKYYGPIF